MWLDFKWRLYCIALTSGSDAIHGEVVRWCCWALCARAAQTDVRRGAMPSLSARVAAAAAETSARAAPANGAKLLTARETANRFKRKCIR